MTATSSESGRQITLHAVTPSATALDSVSRSFGAASDSRNSARSLRLETTASRLPSGRNAASSTPLPGLVTSVAKPFVFQSSGSDENGFLDR